MEEIPDYQLQSKGETNETNIQRAFITGAARGIGAAIARHLAAQKFSLVLHYHSSKEAIQEQQAYCENLGARVFLVQGDLTNFEQVERICLEAEEAFGGIDLLVNNVGNYIRKPLLEMSPEEWRDQIESNLYTSYYTCRQIIPKMETRGYGHVVNIGYAGAQQLSYNRKTIPYAIAKTGVYMLTRSLAACVAAQGVRVNCLGMGVMENSVRKPKELPSNRCGSYSDICNALDFLIDPKSGYINGAQLDISGGWLAEQVL